MKSGHHVSCLGKLINGGMCVFIAEALAVPTGLLTVAFLAAQLGPAGYGHFFVCVSVINWIEWSVASIFSRASIKMISHSPRWQEDASLILRVHMVTSLLLTVVFLGVAPKAAYLLHEPALVGTLQLLSLDIPLFSLAQAHRNILIGRGFFRERAWAAAARWLSRLLLIVALVLMGLSLKGAVLGCLGASLAELAVCRRFVKPRLFGGSSARMRPFLATVLPLSIFALCLRLFEHMDLFFLKMLGAGSREAGYYGIARNLAIVPGLITMAFTPLFLSTLSRLLMAARRAEAKHLIRQAYRFILGLLPFAALTAGASTEIVQLVAGPEFSLAGEILGWLIFAALALVLHGVSAVALIADDCRNWPFLLTIPILPAAALAHWLVIPVKGASGAAGVTAIMAIVAAVTAVAAVAVRLKVVPPFSTLVKAVVISLAVWYVAAVWRTPGLQLLIKLPVLALVIPLAFLLLREFSFRDLRILQSAILARPNVLEVT